MKNIYIYSLEMYANGGRVLLKSYLAISLLLQTKLKEILDEVKKAIQNYQTRL